MRAFRDRIDDFEDAGAKVYGVSIDTPFTLNEFRRQNDPDFALLSDTNRELVHEYDVAMDFAGGGSGTSRSAVFVVDGEVTYAWVSDDPAPNPTTRRSRRRRRRRATDADTATREPM